MTEAPLNVIFGEEIARLLSAGNLNKASLAARLGIENSEVSRLIRGQMFPKKAVFEELLLCLNANPAEQEKLRRLFNILTLERSRQSEDAWSNAHLRAMRIRRGLTLPMLSNWTGIATSRLPLLDLKHPETVTPGEEQRLRNVLMCATTAPNQYESGYPDSMSLEKAVIPLLKIEDLRSYARGMKLEDLARECARNDVLWQLDTDSPAVAVVADCSDLQLAFPGIVILALGDDPEKTPYSVVLWCDSKGRFSLRRGSPEGEMQASAFSAPDAVIQKGQKWVLPVLDMYFRPDEIDPREF